MGLTWQTLPGVWIALSLGVYVGMVWLQHTQRGRPWAQLALNPLAGTVAIIIAILSAAHVSYATYFEGSKVLHALLGPSTVALAVPLYEQRHRVRAAWAPLAAGLAAGSITAIVTAVGLARLCGASPLLLLSFAPKSVTTPIAIGVSEHVGGSPAITTAAVLFTGIVGSVLILPLLDTLKIRQPEARGFAMGLAAHGVGTARALQVSREMGAFAGLAMGMNGVFTALVIPVLLPWLTAP